MSVQPQDLISHLLHTARSIERMCDNEARQTGLTGSQARLLCFLSIVTLGQDIYQKDIEEAFGIRPSSATGLLQALDRSIRSGHQRIEEYESLPAQVVSSSRASENIFEILVKTDAARHQHTVSLFHSVICRETVSKFAPTRMIFLPEC